MNNKQPFIATATAAVVTLVVMLLSFGPCCVQAWGPLHNSRSASHQYGGQHSRMVLNAKNKKKKSSSSSQRRRLDVDDGSTEEGADLFTLHHQVPELFQPITTPALLPVDEFHVASVFDIHNNNNMDFWPECGTDCEEECLIPEDYKRVDDSNIVDVMAYLGLKRAEPLVRKARDWE